MAGVYMEGNQYFCHKEAHMSNAPQRTIFLVDDDELLVNMLRDYLVKNTGSIVRVFNTGEDCVKELLHTQPSIIVLDFHLNSMYKDALNGLQVLDVIRKLNKQVHVIMLSSQERYGLALQTIQHGAERYVIKGESAFKEVADIISAIPE